MHPGSTRHLAPGCWNSCQRLRSRLGPSCSCRGPFLDFSMEMDGWCQFFCGSVLLRFLGRACCGRGCPVRGRSLLRLLGDELLDPLEVTSGRGGPMLQKAACVAVGRTKHPIPSARLLEAPGQCFPPPLQQYEAGVVGQVPTERELEC